MALRNQVEKALTSLGVTGELKTMAEPKTIPLPKKGTTDQLARAAPAPEMEALLTKASDEKAKPQSTDDFWNEAANAMAKKSANPEVISLEEARKLGIISDGK
jgi:hypothetical protein